MPLSNKTPFGIYFERVFVTDSFVLKILPPTSNVTKSGNPILRPAGQSQIQARDTVIDTYACFWRHERDVLKIFPPTSNVTMLSMLLSSIASLVRCFFDAWDWSAAVDIMVDMHTRRPTRPQSPSLWRPTPSFLNGHLNLFERTILACHWYSLSPRLVVQSTSHHLAYDSHRVTYYLHDGTVTGIIA